MINLFNFILYSSSAAGETKRVRKSVEEVKNKFV